MSSENKKEETKPTFPSDYVVPAVWAPNDMGGTFGSTNRPSAGSRFEASLPKGDHAIQLYSCATPNGQKITIMLEELGIEYDAWFTDIFKQEQFGSEFTSVNPNSKIPIMIDYTDKENPINVFETGSILMYLAEKEGKFLPTDLKKKTDCINWLMWQMGTAPYLGGGFGHFYRYAPVTIQYAIDRYTMETKRILDVLDKQLEGKLYVIGDEYTIADISIYPWIRCLKVYYNAEEFLEFEKYTNVKKWMDLIESRDAVQRGVRVNGFGDDAVKERHSKKDFE